MAMPTGNIKQNVSETFIRAIEMQNREIKMKAIFLIITSIYAASTNAGPWDKIGISPSTPTAGIPVFVLIDVDFKSSRCGYQIDYGDGEKIVYQIDQNTTSLPPKIEKIYERDGQYKIVVSGKNKGATLACPIAPVTHDLSIGVGEINTSEPTHKNTEIKIETREPISEHQVSSTTISAQNISQNATEIESVVASTSQIEKATLSSPGNTKSDSGFPLFLLLIALAVVVIFFIMSGGKKCPKCGSNGIDLLGVFELDRWIGKKRVVNYSGKVTSGRIGTREVELKTGAVRTQHLNVTMAENRYHYKCKACNHEWKNDIKEEK